MHIVYIVVYIMSIENNSIQDRFKLRGAERNVVEHYYTKTRLIRISDDAGHFLCPEILCDLNIFVANMYILLLGYQQERDSSIVTC